MDTPQTRKQGSKKIVAIVLILASLGFLIGGAVIFLLNCTRTDSEGYALSNTVSIDTKAYAFALWLDREPEEEKGELKFIVTSTNATKELFVGYAEETEANSYVLSIEYGNPLYSGQKIYGWNIYTAMLGWTSLTKFGKLEAPSRPPAMETFWLQELQTKGTTALYWDPVTNAASPRTLIVIMNSDGSRGIQADIVLGYKAPILPWIPYLLIPVGLIVGAIGLVLLRRK